MPPSLKNDEKSEIREKKLRMYESVIDKQIPNNRRIYKLFELPEERLLRLEIKYYENKIKEGK